VDLAAANDVLKPAVVVGDAADPRSELNTPQTQLPS
jgi:hypothetical protein